MNHTVSIQIPIQMVEGPRRGGWGVSGIYKMYLDKDKTKIVIFIFGITLIVFSIGSDLTAALICG